MTRIITFPIATILFFSPLIHQAHSQEVGARDTGFNVTLVRRTEFPPGFEAGITTTSYYPCAGYRMRPTVTWNSDTVSIDIGGFVRPSPCFETMSRATGNVYLGDIADGKYLMRLRYRGDADLYKLKVRNGQIAIDPIISKFTELIHE